MKSARETLRKKRKEEKGFLIGKLDFGTPDRPMGFGDNSSPPRREMLFGNWKFLLPGILTSTMIIVNPLLREYLKKMYMASEFTSYNEHEMNNNIPIAF